VALGIGKSPGMHSAVSGCEIESERWGEQRQRVPRMGALRGMVAAGGPRGMQVESAWAGHATGGASGRREQVSRARHTSQVGASSAAGSGEAECGMRRIKLIRKRNTIEY
jgi:hypothetical protein